MDNTDYKTIILSLVRTHPSRRLTIQELKQDLLKTACVDLHKAAHQSGFENIIEFLESFSDVLKMHLNGARTVIEAIQPDHISEMNKQSK